MEHSAIDLHKNESQIRIVTAAGEVMDRRVVTRREALTKVFGARPQTRILIEASTESEWVARHLESLGHEVVVADPNYAPMYGTRTRRIKTDDRDVAALTEACLRETYRASHRRSPARRAVQADLTVRDALVQIRTRVISMSRALTRAEGLRIQSGKSETFLARLRALEVSPTLGTTLTPVRAVLELLNEELERTDGRVTDLAQQDPDIGRLMTVPGVGPVVATAFVAALDDVSRFRTAGQVTSYLGLVPREYSSGERCRRGRILRSAQPRAQSLLVQAAWCLWRSKQPGAAALRAWTDALAGRRGKRVAVIALARRLARILFAMWRDRQPYQADRIRDRRAPMAPPVVAPRE
jgi:transposase